MIGVRGLIVAAAIKSARPTIRAASLAWREGDRISAIQRRQGGYARDPTSDHHRIIAMSEITVRPLDFEKDTEKLKSFLDKRDGMRLDHLPPAVEAGDCFAFVADEDGIAIGWSVVHIKFRADQDWDPPDDDTVRFQSEDNAYLENIEVTARVRRGGVGKKLLRAAEDEARKRGKKTLWLHTSENNTLAHRFYDRDGWTLDSTVYPPWRPAARTRIYRKAL